MKMYSNLSIYGVSVLTQVNNKNHRKAYENTPQGRTTLKNEHPEIADEIIAKWNTLNNA